MHLAILTHRLRLILLGKSFLNVIKLRQKLIKKKTNCAPKKISHKKRRGKCLLKQNMLALINTTYHAVLELQQGTAPSLPTIQELPFDASARGNTEFMQLAHALVQLKWTHLLLARALLQFYEPHQLVFFYSIGVKEHLNVTAFPDDRKQKNSIFRYEMRTTSERHKKEFIFGHIVFSRALKLKGMWMSLKPRGDVPGFAKLTFKPCSATLQCPTAEFN